MHRKLVKGAIRSGWTDLMCTESPRYGGFLGWLEGVAWSNRTARWKDGQVGTGRAGTFKKVCVCVCACVRE